jgi:hypothetical protein
MLHLSTLEWKEVTENSELDYFQVILRIMPRAQQQAN